jgi:predicted transcriptional regulator
MAKGKTKSSLSYSERKETAFDLFTRHWTNADIARHLEVTPETISSYKKEWEKLSEEAVWNDPNYLNKILEHTRGRIDELEKVISRTWDVADGSDNQNAKVSALRTIKDTIMDVAKLQRLTDTRIEIVNQAEKALQVQTVILEMINQVIQDCPRCKQALSDKLREASALREGKTQLGTGVIADKD